MRELLFVYYFIFSGVQLFVHNRAGGGEGATVFGAVAEESVPLVVWKLSMSPALLNPSVVFVALKMQVCWERAGKEGWVTRKHLI